MLKMSMDNESALRIAHHVQANRKMKLCTCSCMDSESTFLKSPTKPKRSMRGISSIEEEMDREVEHKKSIEDSLARRIEDELRKKDDRDFNTQVNMRLEIGKMRKLLAETIALLKCAMCVPQLMANDCQLLKRAFAPTELDRIKTLLKDINFNTCSLFGAGEYEFRRTNFFTESSASSIEKFYTQYKDKEVNPRKEVEAVWTVNNILHDRAKTYTELFTEEMKANIPEHIKEIIVTLERLFDHIISEICKSPKEAEEEEIELSQMFLAFEHQGNEMIGLNNSLRPAIEDNLLKLLTVCDEVQSLKDQRTKLKEFLVNSYQKIKSNLEKKNVLYNLEAVKTTTEKMEPRNDLMAKHETLLKDDLDEEKSLRIKKHKVEQVLKSVIDKYDQGMEEREKNLAHLTAKYDEEVSKMNLFQERYNKQEEVYELLMNEKSVYEEELWFAKLREVKKKAAARKIQRFWRRYLMIMQAQGRKKGKGKGKGKKKS